VEEVGGGTWGLFAGATGRRSFVWLGNEMSTA